MSRSGLNVIRALLKTKFPEVTTIYVNKVPDGFETPSFFVQQATVRGTDLTVKITEKRITWLIVYFASELKDSSPDVFNQVDVIDRLLNAFQESYQLISPDGVAFEVADIYGGQRDDDVYISVTLENQGFKPQTNEAELMQDIDFGVIDLVLGLPAMNIAFKSAATAAIQQGASGTLALVLKDSSVTNLTEHRVMDAGDIPGALSVTNVRFIEQALMGTPREIKLIVIPESAANYTTALDYLETIKFNLLAFPGIVTANVTAVGTWAKGMYDLKKRKIMVLLPNHVGDHPAIVNFATDDIEVGTEKYSASQYSARVAGILAGLSLSQAPTFFVLPEVTNVPKLTETQANEAIAAGKLILYHDGEKVKIARGVTSLTTITEERGEDWQKIKVVRILNLIYHDIKKTTEDNYIGKVSNTYPNKLLLTSAINVYYETLEEQGLLDPGLSYSDIAISAQRTFLKTFMPAVEVEAMSDQEVKEANTKDKVFISGPVRAVDSMEDIFMDIYV